MDTTIVPPEFIHRSAEHIRKASALLITAGAGMGVDSGLPDFRGTHGFWNAYPPYARLKLDFYDLARPEWFEKDPELAWGFYGHRLELYRRTVPHGGFTILLNWARAMARGAFVFTSNVDGQFQRAGFAQDHVNEVHGSIHALQCLKHCGIGIFPSDSFHVDIDSVTFRARGELPRCPNCGSLARPNIVMFNDGEWENDRSRVSADNMQAWLKSLPMRELVIIECGAGIAIPTVRFFSEQIAHLRQAPLIRINVREFGVMAGQIGIGGKAMEVLTAIDAALSIR